MDNTGKMLGVVKLNKALEMADKAGLDLVEVSPHAKPPVCKILDYGKFKFEAQKKAAKARKKQKIIDIKEVKFRPNIDTNDFNIKIKNVIKFLIAGDKVKITLRYRGREMAHRELGIKILNNIKEETKQQAKVELEPKLEGRQAIMILAPEEKTAKEKINDK
ncbi:translation initiation factor IF-3 [Alphaproteobacteria bacterium]|nr:translation initiation factor IF-3 [Alphaproteobacteria bacterium]